MTIEMTRDFQLRIHHELNGLWIALKVMREKNKHDLGLALDLAEASTKIIELERIIRDEIQMQTEEKEAWANRECEQFIERRSRPRQD